MDEDEATCGGGIEPGASLGAYRIERRLGSGGMGVVFLAYDTILHRRIALKVLLGRVTFPR
jgi:serine/threonine protein kinase